MDSEVERMGRMAVTVERMLAEAATAETAKMQVEAPGDMVVPAVKTRVALPGQVATARKAAAGQVGGCSSQRPGSPLEDN